MARRNTTTELKKLKADGSSLKVESKPKTKESDQRILAQEKRGGQGIFAAVKEGSIQKFDEELKNGDIWERGPVGETFLHLCLLYKTPAHLELAKHIVGLEPLLVKAIYESDLFYGESCLHLAVVNRQYDMVKFLIDNGANLEESATGQFFQPSGVAYYGETPLSFAACTNQPDVFDLLIENGADPHTRDKYGNTVLHMCVRYNLLNMFKHIRQTTAVDPHARNELDETPLIQCAKAGSCEMFEMILNTSKQVLWEWGPVTCCNYPLTELDTVNDEVYKGAIEVMLETQHSELISLPIVKRILKAKWRTFGKKFFLLWLGINICYLSIFMGALWMRSGLGTNESPGGIQIALELITVSIAAVGLILEVRDVFSEGVRKFIEIQCTGFGLFQRVVHMGSAVAVILAAVMRLCSYRDGEEALVAISCTLLWSYVLTFAAGHEVTGPFIVMIYKMLRGDVFRFMIIFLIIVMGFSQAFYILFLDQDQGDVDAFKTPHGSVMSLIRVCMGDFEFDILRKASLPGLAISLYLIFVLLSVILLLNLLIAMMGSTYQNIDSNAKAEWRLQWAFIIVNIEKRMGRRLRDKYRLGNSDATGQRFLMVEEYTTVKPEEDAAQSRSGGTVQREAAAPSSKTVTWGNLQLSFARRNTSEMRVVE